MGLRGKKKIFHGAFIKTFGNVTQSCMAAEVHRTTYYDWRKNDPEFLKIIDSEDVAEAQKDMIESKLNKLAVTEDRTILIFLAKTKCKDRGYVERVEHQEVETVIQVNTTKNYLDAPTQQGEE